TNHSHQSPSTIHQSCHSHQSPSTSHQSQPPVTIYQSLVRPSTTEGEFVDDIDFNIDFGLEIPTDDLTTVEMVNVTKESFDEDDFAKFQELLLDAEKPLYKGCPDFTKLFAIVKLLNLKGKYGASDKFFTELLGLLKKILPAGVDTYDASIKENFNLRVVVLWTINDYLALGTLYGCHAVDLKLAPNPLTREQIYNEVQHIENKLGKGKRTNNKTLENQEDTRGRGRKIQKQKRKTTEEEGSSNLVNEAYWK
nr:hypothetical protein [Tanacetum cinerariifolium]